MLICCQLYKTRKDFQQGWTVWHLLWNGIFFTSCGGPAVAAWFVNVENRKSTV